MQPSKPMSIWAKAHSSVPTSGRSAHWLVMSPSSCCPCHLAGCSLNTARLHSSLKRWPLSVLYFVNPSQIIVTAAQGRITQPGLVPQPVTAIHSRRGVLWLLRLMKNILSRLILYKEVIILDGSIVPFKGRMTKKAKRVITHSQEM